MQCTEFYKTAGQWMEGETTAAGQAHLAQCARCRGLLAELQAVVAAARELEATEPPERIWVSLRAQLEGEGMIRGDLVTCESLRASAEEWLGGARPREAQAHMAECISCRTFADELESIAAAGRMLEAEMPAPPERVWVSLRNQLEAEGLVHEEAVQPATPQSWAGVFSGLMGMLRRPALAAAYVAVLVLAVVMLPTSERGANGGVVRSIASKFGPVEPVEQEVKRVLAPALAQKNPAMASAYRDNLAIVDKFIALCEKTVRENPNDPMAREYLLQAYQQKTDLLSALAERSVGD